MHVIHWKLPIVGPPGTTTSGRTWRRCSRRSSRRSSNRRAPRVAWVKQRFEGEQRRLSVYLAKRNTNYSARHDRARQPVLRHGEHCAICQPHAGSIVQSQYRPTHTAATAGDSSFRSTNACSASGALTAHSADGGAKDAHLAGTALPVQSSVRRSHSRLLKRGTEKSSS